MAWNTNSDFRQPLDATPPAPVPSGEIDRLTDDEDEMTRAWISVLLHSVSVGDELYINDRSRPLTVDEKQQNKQEDGYHYVVLRGNGTEYGIVVNDEEPEYPSLRWPNGEKLITWIEIADKGERVIASNMSAEEFVSPRVEGSGFEVFPDSTRNPDVDRDVDADSVIGTCPECDEDVVQDEGERVLCTGCGLWCWEAEWNAYEQERAA